MDSRYILAWAFFFCRLYIRSGSIWPCVVAHSAQNTLAGGLRLFTHEAWGLALDWAMAYRKYRARNAHPALLYDEPDAIRKGLGCARGLGGGSRRRGERAHRVLDILRRSDARRGDYDGLFVWFARSAAGSFSIIDCIRIFGERKYHGG